MYPYGPDGKPPLVLPVGPSPMDTRNTSSLPAFGGLGHFITTYDIYIYIIYITKDYNSISIL